MSEDKSDGSRGHDVAVANALNDFMSTGWSDTPLVGLTPAASVSIALPSSILLMPKMISSTLKPNLWFCKAFVRITTINSGS